MSSKPLYTHTSAGWLWLLLSLLILGVLYFFFTAMLTSGSFFEPETVAQEEVPNPPTDVREAFVAEDLLELPATEPKEVKRMLREGLFYTSLPLSLRQRVSENLLLASSEMFPQTILVFVPDELAEVSPWQNLTVSGEFDAITEHPDLQQRVNLIGNYPYIFVISDIHP